MYLQYISSGLFHLGSTLHTRYLVAKHSKLYKIKTNKKLLKLKVIMLNLSRLETQKATSAIGHITQKNPTPTPFL
jgi:hypothetical protein